MKYDLGGLEMVIEIESVVAMIKQITDMIVNTVKQILALFGIKSDEGEQE